VLDFSERKEDETGERQPFLQIRFTEPHLLQTLLTRTKLPSIALAQL
jgi:hypothetical protein